MGREMEYDKTLMQLLVNMRKAGIYMTAGENNTIEKDDIIDNWDPILLAYPFVRKGMTAAEYDEEMKYLSKQTAADLRNETYMPLWKQREIAIKKLDF